MSRVVIAPPAHRPPSTRPNETERQSQKSRTSDDDPADKKFSLEASRPRQTEKPSTAAGQLGAVATNVLVAGTAAAAGAALGPAGALAVVGTANALSSSASAGATAAAGGTPTGNYVTDMQALQDQGKANNEYLMSLQQKMQEENRTFTTVSNVIRGKHDTAKAAVNNIRA